MNTQDRSRCAGAIVLTTLATAGIAGATAPPMSDFMGLNIHGGAITSEGHTGDAPGLFRPAVARVRDYHPMSWNLNSSANPTYPVDKWNWINWSTLYGQWTTLGYEVNPAIQFNNADLNVWTDLEAGAYQYGYAFANAFGPTHGSGVIGSAQIGNELGNNMSLAIGIDDARFKTVFTSMSAGIRAADPDLPIVTPSVAADGGGSYHKSLNLFTDITESFDVISTNTYAQVQGYPTWERTYPESTDPRLTQLQGIRDIIAWRDTHAPGKQVWVTEFGYDSTTTPNDTSGTFKDWKGVTDTQQAQWLTRSYLVFASMGVDRAYMYFYNDENEASVHGSAGLMRNWSPKPSYYAVSHLQQTLGDYHFLQAVHEDAESLYVYAFANQADPNDLIWAIWSPTGSERLLEMTLDNLPGLPLWAEQMPLADGTAPLVSFTQPVAGQVQLLVGESPIYLHLAVPEPTGGALIAGAALWVLGQRRGRRMLPGGRPRCA